MLLDLLSPEAKTEYHMESVRGSVASDLTKYRYTPNEYVNEKLGWNPWSGEDGRGIGQKEILDFYALTLKQLHERYDYRNNLIDESQLTCWSPGQQIQNWISVDAGHNVGKTKMASAFVNHFFDTCPPSIIYTFAPSKLQIKDLLWKEISVDRSGKGLPGKLLQLEIQTEQKNHFVKGRATSNSNSSGTERIHGQHNEYLMFVLDEAEGIPSFVWNAVQSMISGGKASIVLILRNPRTRISMAHKVRSYPHCKAFRISCLDHPNVVHDKDIVPNSVTRDYIHSMLKECTIVEEHEEDDFTFELDWIDGVIYKPDIEWLWRVEGIPASSNSDSVFCSVTNFETATERSSTGLDDPSNVLRMGVDVARFGVDYGTIYIRTQGVVWRSHKLYHLDNIAYYKAIKEILLDLQRKSGNVINDVQVRIDGGGGFGATVCDLLRQSSELLSTFDYFDIFEVNFGSLAYDETQYADLATELYARSAEEIKSGLKILNSNNDLDQLQTGLCERGWKLVGVSGQAAKRLSDRYNRPIEEVVRHEVKKLIDKKVFRREIGHSPDDADGFVLAVSPDYLFDFIAQEEQMLLRYQGSAFNQLVG